MSLHFVLSVERRLTEGTLVRFLTWKQNNTHLFFCWIQGSHKFPDLLQTGTAHFRSELEETLVKFQT